MIKVSKNSDGYCWNCEKGVIFAPVDGVPAKSASTIGSDFLNPVGDRRTPVNSQGFCFVGGIDTPAQDVRKTPTGGRSKGVKCSPMERRTLQRRPILQEVLSRLTSAVLGRDFVRRPSPVKQVREGAWDYLALLIVNNPNQ